MSKLTYKQSLLIKQAVDVFIVSNPRIGGTCKKGVRMLLLTVRGTTSTQ